jgi:hypothetical protein
MNNIEQLEIWYKANKAKSGFRGAVINLRKGDMTRLSPNELAGKIMNSIGAIFKDVTPKGVAEKIINTITESDYEVAI